MQTAVTKEALVEFFKEITDINGTPAADGSPRSRSPRIG